MVNINPFFVAAYLNSSLGHDLILQKQTGGISEGINHPDLKEIEIPILSQQEMDEIAALYQEANNNLKRARSNIHEMTSKVEKLVT
jgi:restriction endonuclease S subunit